MQPIGLTLKNIRVNPYTQKPSGEIMLVHYCLACGRISCNRVAGDDNAYAIICLLKESRPVDELAAIKLEELNIGLLTPDNEDLVARALLGNQYQSFLGEEGRKVFELKNHLPCIGEHSKIRV